MTVVTQYCNLCIIVAIVDSIDLLDPVLCSSHIGMQYRWPLQPVDIIQWPIVINGNEEANQKPSDEGRWKVVLGPEASERPMPKRKRDNDWRPDMTLEEAKPMNIEPLKYWTMTQWLLIVKENDGNIRIVNEEGP